MRLIVGLGNPGRDYENTRHNVGFIIIDELAKRFNISVDKMKFNGLYGMGMVQGEKVILLKPLTYMNLSGEAIRPLMDYFNVELENILVIYDDLDLPQGKIRLRTKGSPGGHNGIKSIVHHMKGQEFKRIRVGIGRPQHGMKITDYVLGRFTNEEINLMNDAIEQTVLASEEWLKKPFLEVMNVYNR